MMKNDYWIVSVFGIYYVFRTVDTFKGFQNIYRKKNDK